MASHDSDLNLSVGRRLRELRLERGHTQADLARRLAISPAYLNLIEKGRRTVQLPVLWKALELLEVDPEPFISSVGERPPEANLAQLLDEPLLRSLDLDRAALTSLSAEPRAATTIAALFNLYKNARIELDNVLRRLSREESGRKAQALPGTGWRLDYSPLDEVADFVQSHHNYFAVLEEAVDALRRDLSLDRRVVSDQLVSALEGMGVRVSVQPPSRHETSVVRRYDPDAATLELSSELSESRRKFDLAHVIGLRLLDEKKI